VVIGIPPQHQSHTADHRVVVAGALDSVHLVTPGVALSRPTGGVGGGCDAFQYFRAVAATAEHGTRNPSSDEAHSSLWSKHCRGRHSSLPAEVSRLSKRPMALVAHEVVPIAGRSEPSQERGSGNC
jgi:hypothetical protein